MSIPIPPVKLPEKIVAAAREFAEGRREPIEPRNAATVVLMRPSVAGPEIYLMRRQTTMDFAGGMCVFPGGGVDPRDFDTEVAWAGPSPDEWAAWLGVPDDLARALVCTAVRETFEESGVLLAGPSDSEVVADTTGDDWEADRVALETHELSMTDFLNRRGLVLRTDLLGVWGAWLTPVFEPKRYRTWFFAAVLPEGQITRDVSTESSSVTWMSAMGAVGAAEQGELLMMPPTYLTSLEVGQYAGPADVIAAARGRAVEMHTPDIEPLGDGFTLSMPAHHRPILAAHHAGGGGPLSSS